jgi:hypothetical protein
MPLGFRRAIFIEAPDFIEEKPVILPLEKGGIESLREEITPALIPAFSPREKGNRRPTQCSSMPPVIGRALTKAKATLGRSRFQRVRGASTRPKGAKS